ncbi:cell pole-organizing protein PopZ [Bradyrhizobium sp. i1.8.4]|uniref:PopZ family protein n=1 Tax=unclassified Bradyrhizobium TaxID=2631580 RepID=UPI003D25BCBC
MTQPAKVQEPSMEEILASIRRIIADDEAKPAVSEKPAVAAAPPPPKIEPPPPAAKPAMKSPPPAAPPAAKAAPAPKSPSPAPASNSQDDIDSLLASLDEATPAAEIRPSPQPEADVFELTDDMALPDPAPAAAATPSFRKVEPQDDVEFTEARSRETVREPIREQPPIETAPMQQIISGTTMRAVESAFNSLANTVLSSNARTLEDLVKEMLRPMLKSWLDDNLPGLVERIVKAEIERVSRGR